MRLTGTIEVLRAREVVGDASTEVAKRAGEELDADASETYLGYVNNTDAEVAKRTEEELDPDASETYLGYVNNTDAEVARRAEAELA
jgi:hypothetical protein